MYIFRKVTILFMRGPNEILNNIDRRAVSLRLRRTRTYCLSVYTLFVSNSKTSVFSLYQQ